jgi:hypothetical protein
VPPSAASEASIQVARARRDLRCVILFHLLPCGGVEEANLPVATRSIGRTGRSA